ncbi:MAG: 23S rRNA (adenine(2030)-N(6))-methyltransferase RlmJ [Zetaproteobacteria bacterium CG1_02_49_23]|nr:MAG: 23S rRNA (adenine(2030)-N(6))-methyltransferase RlmJ [Zetaproteobacteria bacterium CG1_02_49_23]
MLSYQHIYHAGNHADVLKYIVLSELVAAMQIKATPMFMLDAFAGRGIYQLDSCEAQKNMEYQTGIARLWPVDQQHAPLGAKHWSGLIAEQNPDGGFLRLPGSSALLASLLRQSDQLACCDLHPQEIDFLRQFCRTKGHVAVHHRDAFDALKGLLPPKEKRGLVFLDPAYEQKDEYRRVGQAVTGIYPHFRAGVYVIWYPVLPAGRERELFTTLRHSGVRKILRIEMSGDFPAMQMQGSGMLIINPPFQAMQPLQDALAWTMAQLTGGKGALHFDWLVGE